jgi:AcrR family transcriptional regulator
VAHFFPVSKASRIGNPTRPRRSGRPTVEQAAQLDNNVRECALRLFLEHGYEGTSMDVIAREAGTTKMSLYARFPSKEELFLAVLEWSSQRPDWPLPEPELPDLDDLELALTAIAHAALRRALHPSMIQLGRIAVTHAARYPEIAQRQAVAFWPRQKLVAELLRRHAATGAIVADEPEILAEHFLGMVAGMPARLASYGIVRDAADQERHTQTAVDTFLRALRP